MSHPFCFRVTLTANGQEEAAGSAVRVLLFLQQIKLQNSLRTFYSLSDMLVQVTKCSSFGEADSKAAIGAARLQN